MKKVVVTGASGLIGKEIKPYLDKKFSEVYLLSSSDFNMFDEEQMNLLMKNIKPQYLIHLAWITGGDYLTNPLNEKFRMSSIRLMENFAKYGGERAVFAGSCLEYKMKDDKICENDSLSPQTPYAINKVLLNEEISKIADDNGIDLSWGRIFYAFGNNEKKGRLTERILSNLMNNQEVDINFGQLKRDYIYTKEIARAFSEILCSDVTGAINICSGECVTLAEYAELFEKFLRKKNLVSVKYLETNQAEIILGDNRKLCNDVGFKYKYSLESAIKEIINNMLGNK